MSASLIARTCALLLLLAISVAAEALDCPEGTYDDASESVSPNCVPCGRDRAEQFQLWSPSGSTSVLNCTCDRGFDTTVEPGVCVPCAADFYKATRLPGMHACSKLSKYDSSACNDTTDWNDLSTLYTRAITGSCHECPANSVALPQSAWCECLPGYTPEQPYHPGGLCLPCPFGTYKEVLKCQCEGESACADKGCMVLSADKECMALLGIQVSLVLSGARQPDL